MESQNGTETENEKKTEKKWTWAEWALLIGGASMFFGPMLLTGSWGWITFDDSTGVIGDTIGGITAPVSGLLGAYLVYKALKAQIDANEEIRKQFDKQQQKDFNQAVFDNFVNRLRMVREDLHGFEYLVANIDWRNFGSDRKTDTQIIYSGRDAIHKLMNHAAMADRLDAYQSKIFLLALTEFIAICKSLANLHYDLSRTNLPDMERLQLRRLFTSTYFTKVYPGTLGREHDRNPPALDEILLVLADCFPPISTDIEKYVG